MRPKSRFGASLQLLAEGTAHLLPGRGDLATLTAFDVSDSHAALAKSMSAFHAGSALAELAGKFVPAAPQDEAWTSLTMGIRLLESSPPEAEELVALSVLWRMVDALGVSPSLTRCARDGRELSDGPAIFSHRDGGLLCRSCAVGSGSKGLPEEDRQALWFFLTGEGTPPDMDPPRAKAHRRLLARWVANHLADGELPAMELWQRGR